MSHFASKKKSVLCQIITEIILSKVTAEILLRKFRLGSLFLVQLQINSLQFYKNILCCGFFGWFLHNFKSSERVFFNHIPAFSQRYLINFSC